LGRVKSLSRKRKTGKKGILKERFLKLSTNSDGYCHVKLYKDGISKTYKVHRLVVEAFIEKDDTREYVNHIDGDKLNNKLSNLERCTPSENVQHAFDNGLNPTIIDIDKKDFRNLVKAGMYADKMSEVLGCSIRTVRRKARKFGITLNPKPYKKTYKIDDKKLIKDLKKKTQRQIAKEIGCSESLVSLMKKDLKNRRVNL
jgi:hypothetical protein